MLFIRKLPTPPPVRWISRTGNTLIATATNTDTETKLAVVHVRKREKTGRYGGEKRGMTIP